MSSPQTLIQPTVKGNTSTFLYLPEVFCVYQYFLGNTSTILSQSTKAWFLQLESCNPWSANPHGCVGSSGLHDICHADDLAGLMTSGEPVLARNGRSVSQITASSRIRRIGEEPGNSEISTGFRELAGKAENERKHTQKS